MSTPQSEWFWAEPARVIAGKYPGAKNAEAKARVKLAAILAEGVSLFVDLTEDGELDAYAHLDAAIDRYHRLSRAIQSQECPQTEAQRAVIRGWQHGS